MTDTDPVRRAMEGDRAAFSRLYERYSRAVLLDLVTRTRDREDAEDALQATFLAAWQNLPRLARPGRFVAWLFRIARNKARDLHRQARPRLVRLSNAPDPPAPSAAEHPDTDAVRRLVSGLAPESRAILLLRVLEGWSSEEVAAAYRLSASTVRRRYARAIEHLRQGLRHLARRRNHDQEQPHRRAGSRGL